MRTKHQTIRSVSLDTEVALWIEQQAAGENRSASNFVNTLLGRLRASAAAAPSTATVPPGTPAAPPTRPPKTPRT